MQLNTIAHSKASFNNCFHLPEHYTNPTHIFVSRRKRIDFVGSIYRKHVGVIQKAIRITTYKELKGHVKMTARVGPAGKILGCKLQLTG